METPTDLYPPSPPGDRRGTEATIGYRLRVTMVLGSLALFLALYLGLVAATGYAFYSLVFTSRSIGWVGFMVAAGLLMLFGFLIKGIFKRSQPPGRHVQLTEAQQPRLFAFVRRLCEDAKSPFPAAIYVTDDVNAAVFYRRSFFSLFLPQKKNLLIGLGLVNALNVSELKAVLAHEFGHFAQSSLKLGQYVYIANQVITDMLARDSWDEVLDHWRRIDLRLSWPAWLLAGVVWAIRKVLQGLFKLVNVANLSLSREMEFDADLHAVNLTGSDAIVSGLWKTERAGIAMEGAWATLGSMIGYGKFSNDLFYHQKKELRRLDGRLDEQPEQTPFVRALREPYRYGAALHFQAGDNHAPSMWSTHPSNREREENAKRHYVEVPAVETPAWELFDHRKSLKKRITVLAYEQRTGQQPSAKELLPAKDVEAQAAEDREEQKQAPHYHGLYESRFVDPGDVEALAREVDSLPADERESLRESAVAWAGEPLAAFMAELRSLEQEEEKLAGDRKRALEKTREKLGKLREKLGSADKAIFRHHYARTEGDAEARAELISRYKFLRAIEEHIKQLNGAETMFGGVMGRLQAGGQLAPEQFRELRDVLGEVRNRMKRVLSQCEKLRVPRLSHLEENTRVRDYLLSEDIVDAPAEDRIDGKWLGTLGRHLNMVLVRLRRLHFKNLGALLRLQEKLDPELHAAAPPPAAEEAEDDGAEDAAEE